METRFEIAVTVKGHNPRAFELLAEAGGRMVGAAIRTQCVVDAFDEDGEDIRGIDRMDEIALVQMWFPNMHEFERFIEEACDVPFEMDLDSVDPDEESFVLYLHDQGISRRVIGFANGNPVIRYVGGFTQLSEMVHDYWGDFALARDIIVSVENRYQKVV